MIAAASPSTLSAICPAPNPCLRRETSAAFDVRRSSCSLTGRRSESSRLRARRLISRAESPSVPSRRSGKPSTNTFTSKLSHSSATELSRRFQGVREGVGSARTLRRISCDTLTLYTALGGLMSTGAQQQQNDPGAQLRIFESVLKHIQDDYVDEPDLNKVRAGALRGLAYGLDPYSTYLTTDQVRDFRAGTT